MLARTPTARQQAGRRRLILACAMVGLALVAGGFGSLTASRGSPADTPATGPFSYFPSE